jgi:hypothetical protein
MLLVAQTVASPAETLGNYWLVNSHVHLKVKSF